MITELPEKWNPLVEKLDDAGLTEEQARAWILEILNDEPEPEIDYNTVIMRSMGGAYYHTYYPECPPDCHGQMEGCKLRTEEWVEVGE